MIFDIFYTYSIHRKSIRVRVKKHKFSYFTIVCVIVCVSQSGHPLKEFKFNFEEWPTLEKSFFFLKTKFYYYYFLFFCFIFLKKKRNEFKCIFVCLSFIFSKCCVSFVLCNCQCLTFDTKQMRNASRMSSRKNNNFLSVFRICVM